MRSTVFVCSTTAGAGEPSVALECRSRCCSCCWTTSPSGRRYLAMEGVNEIPFTGTFVCFENDFLVIHCSAFNMLQ